MIHEYRCACGWAAKAVHLEGILAAAEDHENAGCPRKSKSTTAVAKYVKEPVVVDAVQLSEEATQVSGVAKWCGGMAVASENRLSLHLDTLEGTMVAHPGDWIVRGVRGEFYPVKDEIFRITYREAK